MKKRLAVCLSVVLLVCGLAACGSADATANRNAAWEESLGQSNANKKDVRSSQEESREIKAPIPYAVDLQVVQIPAPSLSNNLIDEPDVREISILLPESYHHNEDSYPVVYFLNGYGSPHTNSASLAYSAMMNLSAEDLIIVCVDAVNRLNCSFYVNSPVTGNWQDFVTRDVVEYMDGNYRTIANASGRGISGHSVGGFGALNVAINTDGIFSHVYAMSPAVFAPKGLVTYGLPFDLVSRFMLECRDLNEQEARERYLGMINEESWQPRYTFDYGSAFVYDENGKAPYILIPERIAAGEYLRDDIWERYQNGLGAPPQQIKENKERLLRLEGLVIEYGNRDELTWVLEGCEYLVQQLNENEIPFDLRVYEGDHASEVPGRLISDVIPYFLQNLGR